MRSEGQGAPFGELQPRKIEEKAKENRGEERPGSSKTENPREKKGRKIIEGAEREFERGCRKENRETELPSGRLCFEKAKQSWPQPSL